MILTNNDVCSMTVTVFQVQRSREDLAQTSAEKQEHESTIIEQQDHIEKLQDSCRELQEAAQALQQDGDQKYAASLAQIKQDRKQQVQHMLIRRIIESATAQCHNHGFETGTCIVATMHLAGEAP